jgi:predicted nucleotidyltransferase
MEKNENTANAHWEIGPILDAFSLQRENVLCIYMFGSRVYGTCSESSDYDYVIVVLDEFLDGNIKLHNFLQLASGEMQMAKQGEDGLYDAQIYSATKFRQLIQNHNFIGLECLFLDLQFKILETVDFSDCFVLDLVQLRRYVSENSSYSWVRAKKKLVVEKDFDPYRAKKTLWHAFRVIDYGKQIGTPITALVNS